MDLNRLFHLSEPLVQGDRSLSKYTMWALDHQLQNYRIVTLGTILNLNKEDPQNPPPGYVVSFVNDKARVLAIFNVANGQVVQCVLRDLRSHDFLTLTSGHQLPYRIGLLPKERTYLDPIVVVEGTIDADVLSIVEPNTIACLTSGLSKLNLEIVSYLTNHVILAYDKDETGQKSIRGDRWKLREHGIKVSVLEHPLDFKDPGDLAQCVLEGRDIEVQMALMNYKVNLRRIKEEML